MKANADKCHLLITCNTNIEDFNIKNSPAEKFLVIKSDSKLSFENNIYSPCTRASQTVHAISQMVSYMEIEKRIYYLQI